MILLHSNILTIHGQVINRYFLKKIKLSDNSTNNFRSFFILTSVKPLILFALYRFQISILFSLFIGAVSLVFIVVKMQEVGVERLGNAAL